MDYFKKALETHKKYKGKISIQNKITVKTTDDLSVVYSPGVAEPCKEIAKNENDVYKYTIKGNTVAIVSDGTAVLGLGDIGPKAAIPVMEGKAMLFKLFAGIDAFPICLDTKDTEKIIETIRIISPVFGGINLEDISAPRSFEIEQRLQDLGIPVFHDDQHGTAIVVLAGLINAAKVVNKSFSELKVVINGSGAAGIAIARLLKCVENDDCQCTKVKEVILCDTNGIIHKGRTNLNESKLNVLQFTNKHNQQGTIQDALVGADVFIGVSKGDLLTKEDIATMNTDSIVFALANPIPEIMPDEAHAGGALVVGTGRSDFNNQVNNVLGFPGVFRGALDARAKKITPRMKFAAANAIASCVKNPNSEYIIPSSLDFSVASAVAKAVKLAAKEDNA